MNRFMISDPSRSGEGDPNTFHDSWEDVLTEIPMDDEDDIEPPTPDHPLQIEDGNVLLTITAFI